jgi:hypothetical protein
MGGSYSTHGRDEIAYVYKHLVGVYEGKRSLGRSRSRWEDDSS